MSASFLSHLHSLAEGKRRNDSQLAVLSGVHGPAFQMPDNIFPRDTRGKPLGSSSRCEEDDFPPQLWTPNWAPVVPPRCGGCSGFTPGETSSTSSVSSPRGKCNHARSQSARLVFCFVLYEYGGETSILITQFQSALCLRSLYMTSIYIKGLNYTETQRRKNKTAGEKNKTIFYWQNRMNGVLRTYTHSALWGHTMNSSRAGTCRWLVKLWHLVARLSIAADR